MAEQLKRYRVEAVSLETSEKTIQLYADRGYSVQKMAATQGTGNGAQITVVLLFELTKPPAQPQATRR
jgi:hypothetical protein